MGYRRRYWRSSMVVGDYMTVNWKWERRTDMEGVTKYVHVPDKPDYREAQVAQKIYLTPEQYSEGTYSDHIILDEEQIRDTTFTVKNSSPQVRNEQASILAALGYDGPIGGGEARALKNLFNEIGMGDLVKRGWFNVTRTVNRQPTPRQIRRAQWYGGQTPVAQPIDVTRLQYCYLFKSPMADVPFEKFVKLARMYKGEDGRLKTAVQALLANPEAAKEIETLDALEILGGIGDE